MQGKNRCNICMLRFPIVELPQTSHALEHALEHALAMPLFFAGSREQPAPGTGQ